MIPERWNQELQDAGFTGTEAIRYDFHAPFRSSATMITRLKPGSTIKPPISLLVTDQQSPGIWANTVRSRLTDLGYLVEWTTLADAPTNKKCIIVLLDQDVPFLLELKDNDFHALRDYLAQISQCVTLWVTKSTQVTSEDPNFGLAQGFVRSVRQELMIDLYMLEVESFEQNAADALEKIVQKVLQSKDVVGGYLDYEFAFHENIIYISRCYWPPKDQKNIPDSREDIPKKIHIGKAGLLESLKWLEYREEDLGDDEIEVHL